MRPTIVFIVGPTSSGKSEVAVKLAERINGEIISSDSMQVYKDMDIITQPPGKFLLSRAVHHLIGIIPPEEEFSVAEFVEKSRRLIKAILDGGKKVIISGGTGLYIKSLIDGIFSAPAKDEAFRRELGEVASREGNEFLYDKLKRIDPDTAGKLHPNDLGRIIRALEVYKLTGRSIHDKKMESSGISEKYDCKVFGLELPRQALYERINNRVGKMFDEGLVSEVKRLKKRVLSLTASKALGIKEVSSFLDGETTLEKAREELRKNTRRYAKRQLTWFRRDERIVWVDANRDMKEIVAEINNFIDPGSAFGRPG